MLITKESAGGRALVRPLFNNSGKLWGKDHFSLNDIKTQIAELSCLALES